MMTREEHMAWAKHRALEYLPDDPQQAFASIASDLSKHPETEDHKAMGIGIMLLLGGNLQTADEMRMWIEGFN